jgi:geranylgeranyl diphosphate synthase type I
MSSNSLSKLKKIRRQIDKSLAQFLKKVKREYKLHLVHPILFESIRDFSLREGKRLRPILLLLSYAGYSKKNSRLSQSFYNAATCMEFLHNFMLIHDDIIDRSDLRRGKPTLHRLLQKAAKTGEQEKLGHDLSIIAGDIVYALAIDAFLTIDESPSRKEEALKYFIKTAAFTAMGEFIDILYGVEKVQKITRKDVILNYTLKTARYTFECPLVVGAILAGASRADIRKLSQMGILIGQAFQIQDDILGIFDSQKNIGKSILSDIAESKKTILVYHAYRKLSPKRRKEFLSRFTKPKKSYQDLVAIRKIFIEAGSLQYSLKEVRSRLKKSRAILQNLRIKKPYRILVGEMFGLLFQTSDKIARQNQIS